MTASNGSRRYLNILIKVGVVVAFGWFVTNRITSQNDLSSIWQTFLVQWNAGPAWMVCLAIALMPCNWLMETIKWRTLMQPGINLSWNRAIAGILSGITLSLFTPNRTGEYGGRILYVDAPFRWRAVIASLTGSFAQNYVYVSFGILALAMFISGNVELSEFMQRGIWVFVVICVLGFGLMYFNLPAIARLISQRNPPRLLRKPWEALSHLRDTKNKRLRHALIFSLLRYAIFTTQYVLLLTYFGVEMPVIWLLGGVAVIFLVQTSIPLPPLVDLVARNEVGLTLWAGFGVNELSVVAGGLTIWIINLAFPALIGLLAIATVNVLRTFGYDKTFVPADTAQPDSSAVDRQP
jgi:NADH:ubiquinone oxidoreductase subunit 3 (subunit A)